MWFTPSVGATSTKLRFYSTLTKQQFWSAHSAADPSFKSNCALSCSSFLTISNCALSCSSLLTISKLCTQLQFLSLQKLSAHTAAEVVHAHSWDLTLKPKNRSNFFTSYDPHFIRYPWHLYMSAYLYKCIITKSWAYTQNLWKITKKRALTQPRHP